MQIATKVIIAMGAVLAVIGLGWLLTGAFAVISGGVATAIVAAMNAINF